MFITCLIDKQAVTTSQQNKLQEELKNRAFLLFGNTGVQPLEYTNTLNTLKTTLLNLGSINTTPYTTLHQLSPTIERFKLLPPVYKCMVSLGRVTNREFWVILIDRSMCTK